MWGGRGRINKTVCFALNLKTGEGKKKIDVFNIEEKQIFASFDRGDLQQLFRREICSWAGTSSGKPPPYCENLLYQQDTGRENNNESES